MAALLSPSTLPGERKDRDADWLSCRTGEPIRCCLSLHVWPLANQMNSLPMATFCFKQHHIPSVTVIMDESSEDLGTLVGFAMYHNSLCVCFENDIHNALSAVIENTFSFYLWFCVSIHIT